jgi:hypothetical protein
MNEFVTVLMQTLVMIFVFCNEQLWRDVDDLQFFLPAFEELLFW